MDGSTDLRISGFDVQPYSARGITQTLTPIDAAANYKRTINGGLIDLAAPQFRKFASEISCSDHTAPALDGVWPGMVVTVDCTAELSYKTAGGSPERTPVPGSTRVDGDFTFYRPRMAFMVASYESSNDEWAAEVSWSLSLEEV